MYEVKADLLKNRLYIKVNGTIAGKEVEVYSAEFKKAIGSLRTGFTALLDLKNASVFDQNSMSQLQGTKDEAVKAGLKKSAMVLDSAILKMQMNRKFKEVGPQDQAFDSVSEAEAFLNE